ncbi:putative hydrolase [compost metagenome]
MLGVARTFYTAGRMGSTLYDAQDPLASDREYDDKRFCLDHFQTKLLHLAGAFQTPSGQRLARVRHERLQRFRDDLLEEIGLTASNT